ncbi:MAG: YbcC family protein [Oscillochloridaceae bacterium umkhey_bin13]
MTLQPATITTRPVAITVGPTQTYTPETIRAAVYRAERRIAPLWPLRYFVAVNPYLGLLDQPFEQAAELLARRAGAQMTAPRAFYAQAIRDGRITEADLAAALAETKPATSPTMDVAALRHFALHHQTAPQVTPLPTVADVAHSITGINLPDLVTEAISTWAGSYFDRGQAYWPSPWADRPAYAAWRAEARHDRTPEVRGVQAFRKTLRELPETALETIRAAVEMLNIPVEGLDAYLHRLLLSIHGWASYARYELWEAELYGREDQTLTDLLAIRMAWEVALFNSFAHNGLVETWHIQKHELSNERLDPATQRLLANDLVLQRALEKAYQRQLFGQLGSAMPINPTERKRVQAIFCIDVRSEIFRRAVETVTSAVETLGFAGFFGFPIEYVRLGATHGGAQCPVLLTPQCVITETVRDTTEAEVAAITARRTLRQQAAKAWRMFKFGPISCFGFVGPVGLAYLKNLVQDTLGRGRPVPHPATFGLDHATAERLVPNLEPATLAGRTVGMTLEQRINAAEGGLRAMSLTSNFARLVLLAGHGSTTVNNPHATGLDCGACGGHTGEANARVAVQILNDPAVRAGLKERGIHIPDDTIFVAGLHDTTTDDVTLFDKSTIPATHSRDLQQLEADLAAAGELARMERSALLKIAPDMQVSQAVRQRSQDWSQVRPEWGLAGCAAFIVAPRERTAGIKLDGRSFLHSYTWQQDTGFGVLELIMTAPMIVASWINLQYYGSTVDNQFFGSGNKTLHNVVGTLGVLEGNSGDLRVGLPWQSVHDGERYIHEPTRLHVLIEAPIEAMTAIIARHEVVQQLLDHGWLKLFALDANGKVSHTYAGKLRWQAC